MEYIITVNGKKFEVLVERKASAQKSVFEPAAVKTAQPKAPADGTAVRSPMPGTIIELKVSIGQQVKKGDVLLILEAMKMENEILADHDAAVESISISKGSTVETGAILMTLK